MPAIAIVGAGPGLGLSIAKIFGGHGFDVALISRTENNLDALADRLAAGGITAAAFPADVLDPFELTAALDQAAQHFGGIDVLEYSPAMQAYAPCTELADVLQVTPENVQPQIEFYLYGAITAVRTVLPGMLARGRGSLLVTTGGSSVIPQPAFGNYAIAVSAVRNWVLCLNKALAGLGVYAGHVAINHWIGAPAPEGIPHTDLDDLAFLYWDLHTSRDRPEYIVTDSSRNRRLAPERPGRPSVMQTVAVACGRRALRGGRRSVGAAGGRLPILIGGHPVSLHRDGSHPVWLHLAVTTC